MTEPQRDSYHTGFEMDESFKGNNRWHSNHEENHNTFLKYAGGSYIKHQTMEPIRSVRESNQRNLTEFSQANNENAFRKVKYNQIETLKELRQEYQILRNLPIQDQFLQHDHMKRHNNSIYNSHAGNDSSSVTSSEKHSRKSKRPANQGSRDAQILSLEKRQLELVIGNSMRKIEQLLNSQIEYKKAIHELQTQLDSKSYDEKFESMSRTMKKNQNQLNERIAVLQRDIQRLNQVNKQLNERNSILENELTSTKQELRKYRDEKKNYDDSLRLEKQRYSTLELDFKRSKMEYEINEKDLKFEIERCKKYDGSAHIKATYEATISRLQEELKMKQKRYQILFNESEKYKHSSPKPVVKEENGQNFKALESLLDHLKDESAHQNKASMDLIASMMGKLQNKKTPERKDKNFEELYQQISSQNYALKNEMVQLRRERDDAVKRQKSAPSSPQGNPTINILETKGFTEKIKILEQEIQQGTISKQSLMKEYQIIKSSYEYTKEQYQKLNDQFVKLRNSKKQSHNTNYSLEELRMKFRETENKYEEENRNLRRKLDETRFLVEKAEKEGNFNINLLKVENESNLKILRDDLMRLEADRNNLRAELQKMRSFYENKLQQKNAIILRNQQQYALLSETSERSLTEYKAKTEREMSDLVKKIQASAELNERYLNLSNRYSSMERQLDELRFSIKKLKGMNEAVDHLWQVKETEYQNLNELMQDMRAH